jgi:hypothetical protein
VVSIEQLRSVFNGLILMLYGEEFHNLCSLCNIIKVVNSIRLRAFIRDLHIAFKVMNNENIISLNTMDLVCRLSNVKCRAYIEHKVT